MIYQDTPRRDVVISQTPSRLPEIFSFVLTGALIMGGFLLTFGQVLA